jgi:hypothetical protein
MSLFWQRERRNLDRRQALAGVPVFNRAMRVEDAPSGGLVLRIDETRGPGFLDRFRPRRSERRYELDAFGAFVVRLVDSQRTVLDIIDCFQKEFGMSRRESELGVVAFVKMLMQRRVISVVIKPS